MQKSKWSTEWYWADKQETPFLLKYNQLIAPICILKSYLHIKTRHLVKIIPTTTTCFSLSRPSSGSFLLPYFEVANACMLYIYGTAAACVWLCRLCLCSFAGVRPVLIQYRTINTYRHNLHSHTHAAAVPYIVSIEELATSKQGKIKLPEDGLERLKHVGVVGSILTKWRGLMCE